MKARTALQHRLWRLLKEDGVERDRFCLAVSGGADSMAMLDLFLHVLPHSQVVVAHIHHGGESAYRQQALDFVRRVAEKKNLTFDFRKAENLSLRSEADLREFRRSRLKEIQEKYQCQWIVTAHHAEDVLETRLIRLMRGTGARGLRALRRKNGVWYRPFLEISKDELHLDLESSSQTWLEDPSNENPRYLRNWIRRRWLPALERKRPGAVARFAQSLEDLVQELDNSLLSKVEKSCSRPQWMALSVPEQRRWIAQLLLSQGVAEFTRGQLEEIRRQLDISKNEHTFRGAGCLWSVNAGQITVSRLEK